MVGREGPSAPSPSRSGEDAAVGVCLLLGSWSRQDRPGLRGYPGYLIFDTFEELLVESLLKLLEVHP